MRELAEASGVSKSNVAKLRRQMVDQGILGKNGNLFDLRYRARLEDDLIRGYEQVLRPKLLFNRFRSEEKTTELALGKLRMHLLEHSSVGLSQAEQQHINCSDSIKAQT